MATKKKPALQDRVDSLVAKVLEDEAKGLTERLKYAYQGNVYSYDGNAEGRVTATKEAQQRDIQQAAAQALGTYTPIPGTTYGSSTTGTFQFPTASGRSGPPHLHVELAPNARGSRIWLDGQELTTVVELKIEASATSGLNEVTLVLRGVEATVNVEEDTGNVIIESDKPRVLKRTKDPVRPPSA